MKSLNDTILRVILNTHSYGQREAASIVGGESRLFSLIASGEIRAEKKSDKKNSKLFCNAIDVLLNARLT